MASSGDAAESGAAADAAATPAIEEGAEVLGLDDADELGGSGVLPPLGEAGEEVEEGGAPGGVLGASLAQSKRHVGGARPSIELAIESAWRCAAQWRGTGAAGVIRPPPPRSPGGGRHCGGRRRRWRRRRRRGL